MLPLDRADGIDFHPVADKVDLLLGTGVNGIYTNGTAGEFYAQSLEEFMHLRDLLASKYEPAQVRFQLA